MQRLQGSLRPYLPDRIMAIIFTRTSVLLTLAAALTGLAVWAQPPGAAIQVKTNAKDGQRYVWIAPGKFDMGCSSGDRHCTEDEKPSHIVEITHGFWMGETPATVAAWKRYRAATGKPALMAADEFGRKLNEAAGDDTQPAVAMTWNEAGDYCHWAGLRLPTEAEWEYAGRAGNDSATYRDPEVVAWFADNSGKKPFDSVEYFRYNQSQLEKKLFSNGAGPHSVGKKAPNAWGLYDMLGNVWEWVGDYYSERYYPNSPSRDPAGPKEGIQRVLRGGAWNSMPNDIRVSYRLTNPPGDHLGSFGFRCAGDLP